MTGRLDRPADQDALSADDVLSEIQIVAFSDFGPDRAPGTSGWVDRRQGRDDMPTAIRLSVEVHGRPMEVVVSLALAGLPKRE